MCLLTCNKDECFDIGSAPITGIHLIVNLSRLELFNPTIYIKSFWAWPVVMKPILDLQMLVSFWSYEVSQIVHCSEMICQGADKLKFWR